MEETKELLRFTTAGSVDDGKSTLIGRLLYDSKSLFQDQLDSIKSSSKQKGFDYVDLSLVTDGLKSEREQGITIDVAYRYFETPKRKFIIADTPGHIQYTRNMVTGASTANLAIILIDARKGVQEQTYRHSFIASLLGIRHLIVCVNKMDLIDFDEVSYQKIVKNFKEFSSKLNIQDIRFIPISALLGDNIVEKSLNMNWFSGGSLLHELENTHISSDSNYVDCRFPIQSVIRPHREDFRDFRGYAGRVEGGIFKPGDQIKVLPSGFTSSIKEILIGDKRISEAYSPLSVIITLKDEIDISRGDMIVKENNEPDCKQDLDVIVTWMSENELREGAKLFVKHTSRETKIIVQEIIYEIDINTLHRKPETTELKFNSIGRIKIRCAHPLFVDRYDRNKGTGSLIFIDPKSNRTVGAGMLR